MTRYTRLLLTTALVAVPLQLASAGERYSTPPAIVLSPDLTSPWVLQLKQKPAPKKRKAAVERKNFWQQKTQKKRKTRATGIFAAFNRDEQSQRINRRKKQSSHARLATPAPQPNNAQATRYIQEQAAQRPIDPRFLPRTVNYETSQKPGSIIIDTNTKYLYLVLGDGKARRYGVGVGKEGFEWSGTEKITRLAEWPSWRPPAEMIARERAKGRELPTFMEGGPANPMGARALYLGSTLYRIHGTNQPWSIGQAVSSGCIRMRNEDVMELYERVRIGAKVIVT